MKQYKATRTEFAEIVDESGVELASKNIQEFKYTKKSSRLSTFILLILLIGFISITGLNIYLGYFRNENQTETNIVKTRVELPDKTKVEAEALNLTSIKHSPVDINSLKVDYWLEKNNSVRENTRVSKKMFEILPDGSLRKETEIISTTMTLTPIIFISEETHELDEFDNIDIDKLLLQVLEHLSDYQSVEIDYTVTTLGSKNYYKLIENLSNSLKPNDVKLLISVLPRWGAEIDYTYYKAYSNFYGFIIDYSKIDSFVDEYRIKAYDYTTNYSVLPGELTPIDWVGKTIQYTVAQNVSRSKITLGINTLGYKWPDREIAKNYNENFILGNLQSDLLFQSQITELIDSEKLISSLLGNDSYVRFEINGKKQILVYPSESYFNTELKELAANYGLKGVIFRM